MRLFGWRILNLSYSAHGGEIDIVARRGTLVIFVEVKARKTRDDALFAITPTKVQRISKAARHWLVRHPAHQACNFRGDAVLITPWRWPEHVPSAFELVF